MPLKYERTKLLSAIQINKFTDLMTNRKELVSTKTYALIKYFIHGKNMMLINITVSTF